MTLRLVSVFHVSVIIKLSNGQLIVLITMGFGKPLLIRYETSGKLTICANNASQYFVYYAVTLLCKSTLYTLCSRYFLLSNTKNSWNQQMTNIPKILLSHVSSLNTSTRRHWRERKQFPYTLPCTATQIYVIFFLSGELQFYSYAKHWYRMACDDDHCFKSYTCCSIISKILGFPAPIFTF